MQKPEDYKSDQSDTSSIQDELYATNPKFKTKNCEALKKSNFNDQTVLDIEEDDDDFMPDIGDEEKIQVSELEDDSIKST